MQQMTGSGATLHHAMNDGFWRDVANAKQITALVKIDACFILRAFSIRMGRALLMQLVTGSGVKLQTATSDRFRREVASLKRWSGVV